MITLALLPRCLSNFKVIAKFYTHISWLRYFISSYNKTPYQISKQDHDVGHHCCFIIYGLLQDCSNCSALAMELLQSCTKSSIFSNTKQCYSISHQCDHSKIKHLSQCFRTTFSCSDSILQCGCWDIIGLHGCLDSYLSHISARSQPVRGKITQSMSPFTV